MKSRVMISLLRRGNRKEGIIKRRLEVGMREEGVDITC